jgi:hypothetical protein
MQPAHPASARGILARARDGRAASRAARVSRQSESDEFVNVSHKSSARTAQYSGSVEGGAALASDQGDGPHSTPLSSSNGRSQQAALSTDALDVQVDGEPSPLKQALFHLSQQHDSPLDHQEVADSLVRLIDAQVEEAVATSSVVRSLSDLSQSQGQAIESLAVVRAALLSSSSPSVSAQGSSSSSPSVSAQGSSSSSPSVSAQGHVSSSPDSEAVEGQDGVQDRPEAESPVSAVPERSNCAISAIDAQIASLKSQQLATDAQCRAAVVEARADARAAVAAQLSPKEKQMLRHFIPKNGPLDKYLVHTSRVDHLRALEERHRSAASQPPPVVPARLFPPAPQDRDDPPARRGPLAQFLQHVPPAQRWSEHFAAPTRRAQAPPAAPTSKRALAQQSVLNLYEQRHSRRFDRTERAAIRTADTVGPEPASPESHDDVDANGYERNRFCVDDDDEDEVTFSDDDSSTDDDTCTDLSDAGSSDEDDDEPRARLAAIRAAYEESSRSAKAGSFLALSASGSTLEALRADDVTIKRRTPRTHILETILTNWLRCNLKSVRLDSIAEFCRQMLLMPHEYAISVYYALTKRVRPISKSFFKMVFRCVEAYIPEHTRIFGHAYRSVKKKQPVNATAAITGRRKPTMRPPSIRDITDIVDATGRFYDEYRHYERDHVGWNHKTMFQCLSPSQAVTFSSQSRSPEADLDAMPAARFIEVWRSTFGFRSSAEVLAALKRVPFSGNILSPNAWSAYHERFIKVLQQAPSSRRPPGKSVAVVFVENCQNSFLEDDVLAEEPADHDAALTLVLDRLNDSGFLQSDGLHVAFQRRDQHSHGHQQEGFRRDRDRFSAPPHQQPRDRFRFQSAGTREHRRSGDQHQPGAAVREHRQTGEQHQPGAAAREHRQNGDLHQPSAAGREHRGAAVQRPFSSQPGAAPPRLPATTPTCTRCNRSGHTVDACVCKHDADGNRLPEVDDATYAKRKAEALKIATARLKGVSAIADIPDGSDTEDIEGQVHASDDSDSSYDGVNGVFFEDCQPFNDRCPVCCGIFQAHPPPVCNLSAFDDDFEFFGPRCPQCFRALDIVPAPSLLEDGDIEANPGPRRHVGDGRPSRRHLELAAYIFIALSHSVPRAASIPAASHVPVWAPVHSVRPPEFWATATCAAPFPMSPRQCDIYQFQPPHPQVCFLPYISIATAIILAIVSATIGTAWRRFRNPLLQPCDGVPWAAGPAPWTDFWFFAFPSFMRSSSLLWLKFAPYPCRLGRKFPRLFPFFGPWPLVGHIAMSRASPRDLRLMAVRLILRSGDVERNPGPPKIYLTPSARRRPPRATPQHSSSCEEYFRSSSGPALQAPAAQQRDTSCCVTDTVDVLNDVVHPTSPASLSVVTPHSPTAGDHAAHPPMPALRSDSDTSASDSDDYDHHPPRDSIVANPASLDHFSSDEGKHVAAFLQSVSSSNSDSSDIEAQARSALFPSVCAAVPVDQPLLLPPRFIGFVCPTTASTPPPARLAIECAVDSMCQGPFSVIKKSLAVAHDLTMRPFSRSYRTANGARVTCTHQAEFTLVVRVKDAWVHFPITAVVWDDAAEQLLICNQFALDTGLIDFCAANEDRISKFGALPFSRDWQAKLQNEESQALAIYHEDFMPEDCDDIVDLSAPLRSGDQDVSTLPPDAKAFAAKFPLMTKAIPRDAHPALEKWQAHIVESKIPLYSWPSCDLKDLKEERLPFRVVPRLHKEFDALIEKFYAEPLSQCPTVVAMRAQLVQKSKTEVRFCVNGSTQKNAMGVGTYPMPHIRNILDFVAEFPYRAKIDMKHGYHNFEVHPDSKKWTTTIGGGRAIAWRKLVQGFASSGAFFQYAVCKLLGDYVWRICAVYLDDIIVVGRTPEECARNVMLVMTRLNEFRFRINFAKCVFTPSTDIDFLGCSMRGTLVYPGPKVSAMLAKIRPPHVQLTPKGQRHHLHVFLGCCAFIMQHCPGLKTVLAPLYVAVASNPFTYGATERRAFDEAMQMLSTLQPFHLPSADPDVVIEIFSDASGGSGVSNAADPGAWAAALGQRRGPVSLDNPAAGFELLQTDGGLFNARQASWDILKKEGFALFQAFYRFKPFVFGRRVRVFTDSKVLMHMFRSESPVIKRWHAFIQCFDYEMHHISSSANALVDCLSRYVVDPAKPPTAPRLFSAVKSVPAPSLLRDGDVESNPGPPKVVVIDSSSSSDSAPTDVLAPISPDAGDKRQSRPPARSRRTPQPHSSSAAPASAVPHPLPQPPAAQAHDAPSDSSSEHENGAAAQAPQAQPAPSTVLLHFFQTEQGPSSFSEAFSEALRAAHRNSPHPRDLLMPFHQLDIRDRVLWFLEHAGAKPMALLYGKSFQQAFRIDKPELIFSHRDDTRVPESWSEYCTAMADGCTFPDLLFVKAACTAFGVQLILFTDAGQQFDISPPNAFRRIFLFVSARGRHYTWARVVQPQDEDAADAISFSFEAPHLRDGHDHIAHPEAFSAALDIGDDKLRWIHHAHNAYTGHPGVAATVQQLMADGHTWRGMTAQVSQFIKHCPTCCSSRLKLLHAPTSAATVRFQSRPLRRWHVDQTGSMGACAFTGFNILLAFICEVTQFTVLFGSRHGTALEAAIALISLMGWLGLAESIHSDGGPENDNYIWHQVTQITGIKHTFSIPNVPSSNPIAERNIQSAKRFLRCLTVDLDKHNAWGLLLPIAQKGLNDLRRQDLLWHSPNEIVFASLADPESFVIPTFYTRPLRELDFVNANGFHISANFAHRAACFQQHVCNAVREIHATAFDACMHTDPVAASDILPGQCILIPWPDNRPPTPTHPLKRGPYKVLSIERNMLRLEHLASPPPADQAAQLTWSKHAHVFEYADDTLPMRSDLDPAASQAPAGPVSRNIDCVLSHQPLAPALVPNGVPRNHVSAQLYSCRMFSASTSRLPSSSPPTQVFAYDVIAHTHAFDSYYASSRTLEGHAPVSMMPSNWSPHASVPSQRPSYPPLPLPEHSFPPEDNDARSQ